MNTAMLLLCTADTGVGWGLQLGRACMQAAMRVWHLNPSLLACLPPQVCVDMGEPILRAADVPTTLEPTQVCA